MSNKFIWIPVLLVTAILISGCIFKDNTTNPQVNSDIIPTTKLPVGFTYMGTHDTSIDVNGSSIAAIEGVYRYYNEDVYIQVTKNDNPAALLAQYEAQLKKQFKEGYDPFKEISLNGHPATQVTDYSTINGTERPVYSVIWSTEKAMILVTSPTTDVQTVITLATATGY